MRFDNQVALITGAGGYIGSTVSVNFAKEGAKVLLCDKNREALEQTKAKIDAFGGTSEIFKFDVTNSSDADASIAKAVGLFGGLDIMVHVAGGSARIADKKNGNPYTYLAYKPDEIIDTVLKVNLYGAMYMSRAASRLMIEQERGGRIINFSSIVGMNGLRNNCDYAAAKGGVIALTKALAKEMGEYKVTVNSIAPGIVQRPGEDNEEFKTNFLSEKCTADDVSDLVLFLASKEARFITGQTYVIDGGRSLAMKGTD